MGYELTIDLKGGRIEIEGDTMAELEKRIGALDIARLEKAIRGARAKQPAAKRARRKRRAP